MSDYYISEGLIEFLQATAPEWAMKLTRERMTFIRLLAGQRNREAALCEAIEMALTGDASRNAVDRFLVERGFPESYDWLIQVTRGQP